MRRSACGPEGDPATPDPSRAAARHLEKAVLKTVYLGLLAMAVAGVLVAGCGMQGGSHGQTTFNTCVPCHGANGAGIPRLRTPAIAGLPEWYIARELHNFASDIRGAHPDDLEGARMRPMARTLWHPGDIAAVARYVARMPAVRAPRTLAAGDVANGQTRFSTICQACHGPDGRGNVATGAPKLVGQWDWYLVAQLNKFHSGMRGANPADSLGTQMRAMSLTLEDSTAIRNVVSYIEQLPTR
jgi:cytochrome c oxidase subunit 2